MVNKVSKEDSVFVAGHKGMVGSAICRELSRQGYKNILTVTRKDLDLRNTLEVNSWFKKNQPDIVILAAAKVGGIIANSTYPSEFLIDNLKIQLNTIESAKNFNCKRFLFLGSSCIYPKHAEQPIKEESLLTGPLETTNDSYAIAKIVGIKTCQSLKSQYDFDAISLMPTNLYGPGDNYHPTNSHVLPALIRRFCEARKSNANSVTCWGSGNPLREFLYVDDLAEACVFVLEKWFPDNGDIQFLNVGTGVDLPIRDLAEMIASLFEFKGEIIWDLTKPDGTPKKQLDISRIRKLGWKAKINLAKGLEKTIKEYKINYN